MARKEWMAAGIGALVALLLLATTTAIARSPNQLDNDHFVYLPLVARDYDPTWTWGEGITVTLTPSDRNILMAIDRQGRVHLLWDPVWTPKFVYHTYLSPSGWTSPTVVAPSLGSSEVMYPPVVAPDGVIHLLWRNRKTFNDPFRVLYATFSNGTWTPEEEVFQALHSSHSLQGMVHMDDAGTVRATMLDCWLFCDTYHAVRRGTWQPAVKITRPRYSGWVWPDRWGGVHFYGNDYSRPPTLYYSYWRDGQFLTRDRVVGQLNVTGGRNTQLDGQNNLHVFWQDYVPIPGGQVYGLYYQCLSRDLAILLAEVLSGYSAVSEVVKGADYTGRIILAWRETERNVQRIRVGVWEGCSRIYLKTVPGGEGWKKLEAAAISDNPGMVCVFGRRSFFPDVREVICADIRR